MEIPRLGERPYIELTLSDEDFLARKDTILRVLNAILNPNSWWRGHAEGWARKYFLNHWIEDVVFKTGKVRGSPVDS